MSLLYIFLAVLLLIKPDAASQATELSLLALKNVVLKTLFPMMVLTRLIANSRGFLLLSKLLSKSFLWRRLRLCDKLLPIVLTGLVSGLPSSAMSIERLYKSGEITKSEADKTLALASLPSPAFVIAVGSESIFKGVTRFLLMIVTTYTVALFIKSEKSDGGSQGGDMSFVKAIGSATTSAILVSGSIVFFSLVSSLAAALLPCAKNLVAVIFEMGSAIVYANGNQLLVSLALGWCGVSAILQLRSEAPDVNTTPYLITRLFSTAILVLYEKIA